MITAGFEGNFIELLAVPESRNVLLGAGPKEKQPHL